MLMSGMPGMSGVGASAALPIALVAAWVAGLASSGHCLVMCGGLSAALGMRTRQQGLSPPRALAQALGYQVGRVASYALAGALCGAFGGTLAALVNLAGVARALRVAAGLVLIALAVQIAFRRRGFAAAERLGARFWGRLAPLAVSTRAKRPGASLLLGAIWGFMPCGMVYSMLAFAALTGGALRGAATMAAFGLGTWPAVFGGSLVSAQLWRFARTQGLHALAGALLMVLGAITAIAPFVPMHR
ncbi:MAG: sulfite exporter TauE/SafE family protein [Gammaproteobacteria bacterium]|nr:sulfite exporter TauE/SafE family protein [Gammaproteobacteria bacterium]